MKPLFLKKTIANALPKRDLAVNRDALIAAITNQVETWKKLEPKVELHAEKIKRLVAIADKLNRAVEAANTALRKLGVDKEIEKAKAERVALGAPPTKVPLGGHSATIDLYLVPWRASDGLQRWNRVHRPKPERPREFSSALTDNLHRLCRVFAKCSVNEFEHFLQELTTSVCWRNAGLPEELSLATLKKRKQRAGKKAGTK